MGDYNINGSGSYSTLNSAISAASATDTINATGTWGGKDTTNVTWNKAVLVRCDADSKQIGRAWDTGDTHLQLQGAGSGHLFTVTADVDIEDLDIQSQSTGVSDEIFRISSAASLDIKRCPIGFDGVTDQQDIAYFDLNSATEVFSFTQCQLYAVGRSIVDLYQASSSTITCNFNSCGSYNIAAEGGRSGGAWVGVEDLATTAIVKAQNCLFHIETAFTTYLFRKSFAGSGSLNVDADNFIFNLAIGFVYDNSASTDISNGQYSKTWQAGNPASGNVGVVSLTAPYDLSLFDDSADNLAQDDSVTIETGTYSGLSIPGTDILGNTRPANDDYDIGPFEVEAAGGGGLSIPVASHHYSKNIGP